jgi:hypothetical protein
MRLTSLVLFALALAAPAFAQRPEVSADSCLMVKHKGTADLAIWQPRKP